jgi:hypothetical protein
VLDEGVLGELGLAIVLGEGGTDEVDSAAVRGWGGDYYVTYRDGGETCFRGDVVMETTRDREELYEALDKKWVDNEALIERTDDRGLRLERCES